MARLTNKERVALLIDPGDDPRQISAHAFAQAKAEELSKAFDPTKHPRAAAGSATGGQFVTAGTSSTTTTNEATAAARSAIGDLSVDAIKRFQRAHGIQVDGKIGRQTAAAILGQSNAKDLPPGPMSLEQRHGLEQLAKRHKLDQAIAKKPTSKPSKPASKPTTGVSSGGTSPSPKKPKKPAGSLGHDTRQTAYGNVGR